MFLLVFLLVASYQGTLGSSHAGVGGEGRGGGRGGVGGGEGGYSTHLPPSPTM